MTVLNHLTMRHKFFEEACEADAYCRSREEALQYASDRRQLHGNFFISTGAVESDEESEGDSEYANSGGNYTWTWVPSTNCKRTATAYVTASLNGQSTSNSTSFNVS
jgi:hypothetical protein